MYQNCEEEIRIGRRKESCAERQKCEEEDKTRQDMRGHERTGEKRGKQREIYMTDKIL